MFARILIFRFQNEDTEGKIESHILKEVSSWLLPT